MRDRLLQVLSLVLLIVVWATLAIVVGHDVIPGPAKVAPELARLVTSGEFVGPLVESLARTLVGFVVGFVAGVAIGIASAKSPWFAVLTAPALSILLFAPTLVIIFLGIAMLGQQLFTVAVICGLAVTPNIVVYMRDVMADFDPDILAMADSFRVPTLQRVRDAYLPYLIPPMLASARIGFSMAWKVVLLAEAFGFAGGLGFQIRIQYSVYDLTALLAWLSIFVVSLVLIEQLIRATERAVVKWQ